MKNKLLILLLIMILSVILTSCGKTATFGEGDTKLQVSLEDGKYSVADGVGNDVVVQGNLKLKLANKGDKELPFILTEDLGGVLIEFNEADIKDSNKNLIKEISTIQITSDEGFINLVPGTNPTYSFSFRSPIGTDPLKKNGGVTKDAFKNANYYFFMGDQKWKLNGEVNVKIISPEEVAKLEEKYQNTEIPCGIVVSELRTDEAKSSAAKIGYEIVSVNGKTFTNSLKYDFYIQSIYPSEQSVYVLKSDSGQEVTVGNIFGIIGKDKIKKRKDCTLKDSPTEVKIQKSSQIINGE